MNHNKKGFLWPLRRQPRWVLGLCYWSLRFTANFEQLKIRRKVQLKFRLVWFLKQSQIGS